MPYTVLPEKEVCGVTPVKASKQLISIWYRLTANQSPNPRTIPDKGPAIPAAMPMISTMYVLFFLITKVDHAINAVIKASNRHITVPIHQYM